MKHAMLQRPSTSFSSAHPSFGFILCCLLPVMGQMVKPPISFSVN